MSEVRTQLLNQYVSLDELHAIFALRDWFFQEYAGEMTEGFKGYMIDAQTDTSNAIIKSILYPEEAGEEVFIEFARQSGKTTIIVWTIAFLVIYFKTITGRRIRIGLFAPQREQAKTDFDRLKEALTKLEKDFKLEYDEHNGTTLKVASGDSKYKDKSLAEVYVFPVSETSNPESKTLDLMIFEESHLINDRKMKVSVFPMGASTNAPRVFIGTAGFKVCYFYRGLNDPKRRRFIFPYDLIIEQRRKLYEQTGDRELLNYENYVLSEKERLGEDSDEFKAAYRLVWIIGIGQFITEENLKPMYSDRVDLILSDRKLDAFVGIDTAKSPDSTVVTVLLDDPETGKRKLARWLELKGENYAEQYFTIEREILGIQRDENDQVIRDEKGIPKYKGGFNVNALAIDSTGQGDFMPDMFQKYSQFDSEINGLFRIKFSSVTKDKMYKNLQVVIREKLTELPNLAKMNVREAHKFLKQCIDLEKDYIGSLLRVKHPEGTDELGQPYHDDYPDSWVLAEYCYKLYSDQPKPYLT